MASFICLAFTGRCDTLCWIQAGEKEEAGFLFSGNSLPQVDIAEAKCVDLWHQLSHRAVKGDVWARPPGPRRRVTATQGTGFSGGSQRVEGDNMVASVFSPTKRKGRCVTKHRVTGSAVPRGRGGPAEKGSVPHTRPLRRQRSWP